MSQTVKDQIIEQIDRLDEPRRLKVLDFARRLATPAGTAGENLLRFAGSIDPTDLEAMSRAIQEGCEKVDPNAW
jgi:hypothetical protein